MLAAIQHRSGRTFSVFDSSATGGAVRTWSFGSADKQRMQPLLRHEPVVVRGTRDLEVVVVSVQIIHVPVLLFAFRVIASSVVLTLIIEWKCQPRFRALIFPLSRPSPAFLSNWLL